MQLMADIMICKILDCGRPAQYRKDQVCQKHYFRFMRTGSYDKRKSKYRIVNPAGYYSVFEPSHEVSDARGYVYEHRFVLFNEFGNSITECALCGREWRWDGGKSCHVDHIDDDITNNKIGNLRPLCNSCNTKRGRKQEHEYSHNMAVEYKGKTMTPEAWSRERFVPVSGYVIRRRLKSGWDIEKALTRPSQKSRKALTS